MRQLVMPEYKTASGKATRYGLGCLVRTLDGETIVAHGGWPPRVSRLPMAIGADRIVIALLANLEQAGA